MAELKTKKNNASVNAFLAKVKPETKRKGCQAILKIFSRATKAKPSMWGTAIIGFGSYRYRYASGREGEWFVAGFAPRNQNVTFYFMSGLKALGEYLPRLGKHKVSGSCLHVTKVEGLDLAVLEKMVKSCTQICKKRNSQDFS